MLVMLPVMAVVLVARGIESSASQADSASQESTRE